MAPRRGPKRKGAPVVSASEPPLTIEKRRKSVLQKISSAAIGSIVRLLSSRSLLAHDRTSDVTPGIPIENVRTEPGLRQDAKIFRDAWGAPSIYAGCLEDAFYLQGVCHAEDRLLQIELSKSLVRGTLSTFAGEKAIPADKFSKTMGWAALGEVAHANLRRDATKGKKDAQEILDCFQAYCDGINRTAKRLAFRKQLPFEFLILGLSPNPWKIGDLFAIMHVVSFKLSVGFQLPLLRQLIEEALPAHGHWLFEDSRPECPPTVPDPESVRNAAFGFGLPRQGGGSNAWCIARDKCQDGVGPLVANDPHLDPSFPSFFYEMGTFVPSRGVATQGMTTPGFPALALPGEPEALSSPLPSSTATASILAY